MTQQTEQADEPRGIACRNCGCRDLRVLRTWKTVSGKIGRRRECRHCGRRMTTFEQADLLGLPDMARWLLGLDPKTGP